MAQGRRQPQSQQDTDAAPPAGDGLPPDLRLYSPFPFKGVNQKASVIAVNDDEFVWLENIVWIGEGQLALGLSNNPVPFYVAPGGLTIVSYPSVQFGGIPALVVFLSNGSAVLVNIPGGAKTSIAPAGTFTTTPLPPCATSWDSSAVGISPYILIGTSTGYFIWDGVSLYQPGTLAPQVQITAGGFGYTSAPAVTISGGIGAGAVGVATIVDGSVVSVQLANPGVGYGPFDGGFLQVQFTGGGLPNSLATATAAIGGGGVTAIEITNGGTANTEPPSITISGGGGVGATAVPIMNGPVVSSALIVTPGVNYVSSPAVAFSGTGTDPSDAGVALIGNNGIISITVTESGNGYLSTPTVVITDPYGSGTGAVAYAQMNNGGVAAVVITNPGENYQAAVVAFVGGNPAVAAATVNIMPQGGSNPVSGIAIQVFKSRVWMVNGTFRYTTATGSVSDFSAAAGGVISQNNDNTLIYSLYGLVQSSGFLYEFGDSEINSISNPVSSTTNNVLSTTYTVSNVDPQIGTVWPATLQPFGDAIVFTAPTGVYAVYGGSLRKISTELDDLFTVVPAQATPPSAATIIMFGIKFYAVTIALIDPILKATRQLILLWDGFRWFIATQDAGVKMLNTVGVGSYYTAYGSDGSNIWACFTTASPTLNKRLVSKFYGADAAIQYKQSLRFYLSAELPFDFTVNLSSEVGTVTLGTGVYPGPAGPAAPGAYGNFLTVLGQDAEGVTGRFLGWELTTTAALNNIAYMGLGYRYYSGYY